MKANLMNNETEKQKIIHHLEKATQLLLKVFGFINTTPTMIQITSIVDYVKNFQLMLQELNRSLPKKCVPIQVFNNLENQMFQKIEKIQKLLQSQKNFKIEVKVLEQKNQQLELKLKEKESQVIKQNKAPNSLEKYLKSQKEREKGKQAKTIQVSERYITEKLSLEPPQKRLSLPYLSSQSTLIPPSQKSILMKQGRPSGSKPKKHPFVTVPGEGNQILIQHLMNKAISK